MNTNKTKIFLVSKDSQTIGHIDEVSQNGSPIALDQVFEGLDGVPEYVSASGVTAGIVDIDSDPDERLSELETMTRNNPQMCTIVVSEHLTQELILAAMQAGARHFLQKGSIQAQLSSVMGRLLQNAPAKVKAGSIITVFSASGGCGATTVALNLAMEMHMTVNKPVLMIDLDRCYGAAATYLDMKSDYGIEDVLAHEGKIDPHLIQSSSCNYKNNFHVLLSSGGSSKKPSGDINPESLRRVLQVCRQTYAYTVIDAPRMDEATVKELSEQSDFTIVVFQLTLKDLKFARSIISTFKSLGMADQKIIPVANRFQRFGAPINADDGQKVLGTKTLYRIRSDWRSAVTCQNKGMTLAEVAPRSAIRKDLQKLISEIWTPTKTNP